MATYAIGDLQGCFTTLRKLLAHIGFDHRNDRLWFTGDLVNRGADSLSCLRFVKGLGPNAITVLGNHDLHLLAVDAGFSKPGRHDTLQPILDAADRSELLGWLRHRPMLHVEGNFALVHAGLPPQWSRETAIAEAGAIEARLRGANYLYCLENMYGNEPRRWSSQLEAIPRMRYAINAFTRMRCVDEKGDLDFSHKGDLKSRPKSFAPWFDRIDPSWNGTNIISGHWSALGTRIGNGFVALDSGCVWGGALSAYRLDDGALFSAPCAEKDRAPGWE
jgi:bis(5'-nucleosyl)-tetraphosphatase (symmetrical)